MDEHRGLGRATIRFAGRSGTEIAVEAGARGTWEIAYLAGERGIAPGGGLRIVRRTHKFWLGFMRQTDDPTREDYCTVETDGRCSVSLRPAPGYVSWSRIGEGRGIQSSYKRLTEADIAVEEQPLLPGDKVFFRVGDTSGGGPPAHVPVHTQRNARFAVFVDTDGDGEFRELRQELVVHVMPAAPAKLRIIAPSVVTVGEEFSLALRAEDAHSNTRARFARAVRFDATDAWSGLPEQVEFGFADAGMKDLRVSLSSPGVHYLAAEAADGSIRGESNPIECVEGEPPLRIFWGDMHNHTEWADGTGTVQESYTFARDDVCLDVCAVTEHIHNDPESSIGRVDLPPADGHALWVEQQRMAAKYDAAGRFVTLLGYEWTPSVGSRSGSGDHCVYFLDAEHELVNHQSRGDLVRLLEGTQALFIPHVGGGWCDWEYGAPQSPVLRLVEIASMHEHSEWFAQLGLARGHKLGIVGMSDGHMGKPGYDVWPRHGRVPGYPKRPYSTQSAVTAMFAPRLDRESIWDALRARRCYATTGERIILRFDLDGEPMGSECAVSGAPRFRICAYGTAPIARIDVIRGRSLAHRVEPHSKVCETDWIDEHAPDGEHYYYVRVTQEDFSLAWSSPIWVSVSGGAADSRELPAWNEGAFPGAATDGAEDHLPQLEQALALEGAEDRFVDLQPVGVYREPRGRFALFRAWDAQRDCLVHINYYPDFSEHRLYISRGDADYGQGANIAGPATEELEPPPCDRRGDDR